MDVEILLFDGFDELDAVGPYEVLANGARFGADVSVATVTAESRETVRAERRETVTAGHGLEVVPDGRLGDPDLLVVPGCGWSSGACAVAAGGATVASVCTGAMLLCDAGLLDGRPATTHHAAHDDLAAYAERIDARVVDDGDVLTAGGVTAGLDLAVYLLERAFGSEVAEGVTREMEYEPRGDVHGRSV